MFRILVFVLALGASLAAPGCSSTPSKLDLSLRRASDAQKFIVELQPPEQPAPINQIHSWQIRLTSTVGSPVTHAHMTVEGGMPQHGHGFPAKPRVTRETAPGTYLLEGMKFSMTGWWEIKLAIEADGVSDRITFNTVVTPPVPGR